MASERPHLVAPKYDVDILWIQRRKFQWPLNGHTSLRHYYVGSGWHGYSYRWNAEQTDLRHGVNELVPSQTAARRGQVQFTFAGARVVGNHGDAFQEMRGLRFGFARLETPTGECPLATVAA